MSRFIDLTGRKFGRLTVIERAGSRRKAALWRCRCDCNTEHEVIAYHLLKGLIISCGCYRASGACRVTHGHNRSKGATQTYNAWLAMKSRCNPSTKNVHNRKYYVDRGIGYPLEWADFENFLRDMGEPPPNTSLDRINNDLGYSKGNCRWADRVTQRRNSRAPVQWVEIDGERMILAKE